MKSNKWNPKVRAKIQQEYNERNKISEPIGNNLLLFIIILSLGAVYFFWDTKFNNIAWFVAFWSAWLLAKRNGHTEGYMNGYHDGILYGTDKISEIESEETKSKE